jgi:hypothetical protein
VVGEGGVQHGGGRGRMWLGKGCEGRQRGDHHTNGERDSALQEAGNSSSSGAGRRGRCGLLAKKSKLHT